MCGIAGHIGVKNLTETKIRNTLDLMKNRGPDKQSFAKTNINNVNFSFLHSRLSILDLDNRSSQPFKYKDLLCVFNGEIYNFVEIRCNLEKAGYVFETSSDTEVLLKSFHFYGESCIDKFEGMWSFAILNLKNGEVFLSRDRFGEKPLYYFHDKITNNFFFGSEIKFIKSLSEKSFNIDEEYLRRFIVLGHKSLYKDDKCSFFSGIRELKPGQNALFLNNNISIKNYWKPMLNAEEQHDRAYWVKLTRENLIKSLEIRMRADVPLSFCLSGGIDSGSLVSIASKVLGYKNIHTFSIVDKDKRYNESKQINTVINDTGCSNTSVCLEESDYFDNMFSLSGYRNGPISTCSYFVHSLLTEQIRKMGFKIGISGVGADEIFTGYFDHFCFYLKHLSQTNNEKFRSSKKDWENHVKKLIRNPVIKNLDSFILKKQRDHIYLNSEEFNNFMLDPYSLEFSEENFTEKPELRNRMLNEMFHEVVRVILHQDDMNSMFNSIENRSPYLDRNLFEDSMKIPTHFLINKGYNKSILRDAVSGILHDDVRLFREKRGFNSSVTSFLDFKSKKFIDFIEKDSVIYNIVKKEKLIELLKSNVYPNSYNKFVFRLISSKMFFDQL